VSARPDLVAEFDALFTRLIGLVEREATVEEAIAVLSIIDARRKRVDHIQAFASRKRVRAAGDALAEVADEWPELVEAWQETRRG
jgi:hypothetical protein